MPGSDDQQKKRKSPQERFFLVMGMLFFLVYLTLGLIMIFWTSLPFQMEYKYRVAFGLILIVYALFRFVRYMKPIR